MESKKSPKANLKKYIKVRGKWRFVPVLKQNGVPVPRTVLIDGEPVRLTSGTFYLNFYENGLRVQRTSPHRLASDVPVSPRHCAGNRVQGTRTGRSSGLSCGPSDHHRWSSYDRHLKRESARD